MTLPMFLFLFTLFTLRGSFAKDFNDNHCNEQEPSSHVLVAPQESYGTIIGFLENENSQRSFHHFPISLSEGSSQNRHIRNHLNVDLSTNIDLSANLDQIDMMISIINRILNLEDRRYNYNRRELINIISTKRYRFTDLEHLRNHLGDFGSTDLSGFIDMIASRPEGENRAHVWHVIRTDYESYQQVSHFMKDILGFYDRSLDFGKLNQRQWFFHLY
jgi:hypothetical protein